METELEPIDASRCQAEIIEGSFMTFGLRPRVRCKNTPTWIGVEIKDGKFYGAMSLCDECKKICEIKMPNANYQKLNKEASK